MPDFKSIAKNGWKPDKDGEGLKDQVGAMLGRNSNALRDPNHQSTPLNQLRDPSTFAPPPKRVPGGVLPPPRASPSSSSAGAQDYGHYGQAQQQEQYLAEDSPPPTPYRSSPGGPPAPPPYSATSSSRPPPSLPPRLPPRTGSASSGAPSPGATPELPGRQSSYLNQDAVGRLGAAGVSVPGFGIGGGDKSVRSPPPPPSRGSGGARAPSQGTTWAQKQESLKTMNNLNKNPHSVSFADARSAGTTANNFRQRHSGQVKEGWNKAKSMDEKYGVSAKAGAGWNKAKSLDEKHGVSAKAGGYMKSFTGGSSAETQKVESPEQSHPNTNGTAAGVVGKKKPPPPPPKRKPDHLGGGGGGGGATRDEDAPPPVPVSTRPY
ncbi:hypothetical protein SLS53_008048 [Cytospora paraplurivora]|uniref:Uncharacterized protein n=1 Tax=Cytospora paraplurivora TaxID=2898453 RepID=A0AAN9U6N3_9PEZI